MQWNIQVTDCVVVFVAEKEWEEDKSLFETRALKHKKGEKPWEERDSEELR